MELKDYYETMPFSLLLTWKLEDGSPKPLNGATVEAYARSYTDGSRVSLNGVVSDGAAGEVRISAPAETFSPTTYDLQVLVQLGAEAAVYETSFFVKKAF